MKSVATVFVVRKENIGTNCYRKYFAFLLLNKKIYFAMLHSGVVYYKINITTHFQFNFFSHIFGKFLVLVKFIKIKNFDNLFIW